MIARPHRSIGEVLALLQEEFPDITISKIRFLESQGLLDPERTPSGYRKFYERDIAKLRWILEQQRDHFLPLKVIKQKLEDGGGELPVAEVAEPLQSVSAIVSAMASDSASVPEAAGDGSGDTTRSAHLASVSLTPDELAAASNLDRAAIDQLEKFGMLSSRSAGSTQIYDDEALVVAKLAAAFVERGLEPRHLRMYKQSADREADVFEQLVTPRHRSTTAESRAEIARTVDDLTALGTELRAAMLRQSLRGTLSR